MINYIENSNLISQESLTKSILKKLDCKQIKVEGRPYSNFIELMNWVQDNFSNQLLDMKTITFTQLALIPKPNL